jgi:hypothetical protein
MALSNNQVHLTWSAGETERSMQVTWVLARPAWTMSEAVGQRTAAPASGFRRPS